MRDDSSRFRYSIGYVFLAESKFVHDLNFDFFLFEHLPPFLILTSVFEDWTLTVASYVMYSNQELLLMFKVKRSFWDFLFLYKSPLMI